MVSAAQQHKGMLESVQKDVFRIRKILSDKEIELEGSIMYRNNLDWAYQYLNTLVKEESVRFISRLEEILDYGIKAIFDDRDYQIKILVEDGKRASIHLFYTDEEGNNISPDIKDCGGGIRTVVGVLMQMFFIFHYDVERILIIDEGLSQVSSEYLPNLFGLVDEMAKKNGLKVLLITHDSRMMAYASKQYVVENHRAREA